MATVTTPNRPTRRFIKRQDVESITGLSRSEIYRRMSAKAFPQQIALSPKCVVWIESEIMTWCDERIAESRGEVA